MTTTRHLQLVTQAYQDTRRAYAVFVDTADQDFQHALLQLENAGTVIINGDEDRGIDDVDMRLHLQCLSIADDLILPDVWWSNARAHMLVQIAGWAGIRLITPAGTEIPTTSARGRI